MDASRHVAHVISAGEWLATRERGTVTLSYADRCRRRVRLLDDAGVPLLVDLVYPAHLSDGDGLVTADGTIIRVIAKPEPLIEAIATDAQHLELLAKLVRDRRVPVQVMDDRSLRITPNEALEQTLRGLGAKTRTVTAPFRPESRA
jgi:urease accessory protein